MSETPPPPRRDGISRRDFFQGRFWHAISLRKNQTASSSKRPHRRPLVMRYPKSLREVAANDRPSENEPESIASASATAARRRSIPVLRPPGAISEDDFLAGCTRCNRCLEVCPHDAIIHAPARFREAAGTPMIDPDQQPCQMCVDFPCIASCEPNVLTRLVPKMMGTAKVTEHLCLAHHGTTCTVCSERCPIEGAITVREGKPTVNETSCTGCGVCRYVCPAPENAILLMPTFVRPTARE